MTGVQTYALPISLVLPLDEMWRALRAGPGMVSAFDAMTRLNRAKGELTVFLTHSLDDLKALPTPEDRAKAAGMMDRCDTVILGALAKGELERVSSQRPLTQAEIDLVSSWSSSTHSGVDGAEQRHPGRGRVLIKIGTRPGTPAQLQLTDAEADMFNTDAAIKRATHHAGERS